MIERKHRFHGYSSLRFAYNHGQTVRNSLLSLRFVENGHRQTWRLAVIVSRKVSKSAVERNRIRRRIYEIFRQQDESISKPFDFLVVVFSPSLGDMKSEKLSETILELLQKTGLKTVKISSKPPNHRDIVNNKEK